MLRWILRQFAGWFLRRREDDPAPVVRRTTRGCRLEIGDAMTHVTLSVTDTRGRTAAVVLSPFEASAVSHDLASLARMTGTHWVAGEHRPAGGEK